MGTNFFIGEISYITKALAAVLQLAVTMDYSIFLWHSYEEQKTLHPEDKKDGHGPGHRRHHHRRHRQLHHHHRGLRGPVLHELHAWAWISAPSWPRACCSGVIGCVTILPALILLFDKPLEKLNHKRLLPRMDGLAKFITKHYLVFLIAFVILLVPAIYGYVNTGVYYDMGQALPKDLECVVANTKLQEEFDMSSTHMILIDKDLPAKDTQAMMAEINSVDGVKMTIGFDSLVGSSIPEEVIPDDLTSTLKDGNWQMILVSSKYKVASDEVNAQVGEINEIIKKYDKNAMLIGEAPCTKDMITITDHDFKVVDAVSIAAIFLIIFFVLKSVSLPFILVAVIEFAIFINLGIPYYTGTLLPFVAPICISTIQLGATVDYAILMTSKYKKERSSGQEKRQAITNALSSALPSIIVSALGFFAATFGVALYSDIDIISSMCSLMARGAIISMLSVIFVLPAMFMLFDKLVCKTSLGFKSLNQSKTEVRS
jgi:predicted RND superfamily exporter protein